MTDLRTAGKVLIDRKVLEESIDQILSNLAAIDGEWGMCRTPEKIEADGDAGSVVAALRAALEQPQQDVPTGRGADRYFYEAGFNAGKRAALEQPQHEPERKPTLADAGCVLGAPYPDWPEWCQTFNERLAYQQGVADARALAAQQEPEPAGHFLDKTCCDSTGEVLAYDSFGKGEPFYKTPPPPKKREWVGLTNEEYQQVFDDTQEGGGFYELWQAIEAKLKQKNAM